MAKPTLTEGELQSFQEMAWTVQELLEKMPIPAGIGLETITMMAVINIKRLGESSRRLEKASNRLNYLTWALIGLTLILALLTGVTAWDVLFR
jgi:hypothetical protein